MPWRAWSNYFPLNQACGTQVPGTVGAAADYSGGPLLF